MIVQRQLQLHHIQIIASGNLITLSLILDLNKSAEKLVKDIEEE